MKLNSITTGIELAGTTVKNLYVKNNIVDIEYEGERNFGMNINEPLFEKTDSGWFAQMVIDFEIEVIQGNDERCKIQLSLEGAFLSQGTVSEDTFKELVIINGASAIVGIARGKIEAVSGNIFNNGKIVMPFVNIVDYYKNLK